MSDAPENHFAVHNALLTKRDFSERSLLIHEDINPAPLIGEKLRYAFAAPLRIRGMDASLVNVIVEVES
ncbi:hypothetical protein JCM19037_3013 [Geomicrobium sp. JCM 19037]|uniref:hypothetical protein n=1 Tax=Geomicrobium sp. JCM 19037 TaxID=1460634 RepID=UPI00045F14FF|nr:hypothetical protein [Geomicrobium sp. JCM 19037]GAK04582.1 hypothetical protein JCM19037_3013 [Geomicrobium sp. JCM 19037]